MNPLLRSILLVFGLVCVAPPSSQLPIPMDGAVTAVQAKSFSKDGANASLVESSLAIGLLFLVMAKVLQGGGGAAATLGTSATPVVTTSATAVPCRWDTSMQKGIVPTKEELIAYRRTYETVLYVDIPEYYKGRAGRYLQVDTARVYELGNILNDLFYGKTPDARTHRMMVAGNFRTKTGANKKGMEVWMSETYPDIRSKKKRKDTSRQTTMLEYAIRTGKQYGRGAAAKSGR